MISVTDKPISPGNIINSVQSDGCGCVVTYIGIIRNISHGKKVLSVEYRDTNQIADVRLREIAAEAEYRWQLGNIAVAHRTGRLKVGDINLVIAVATPHRREGFAACRFLINQFKQRLPTHKTETYTDGSAREAGR